MSKKADQWAQQWYEEFLFRGPLEEIFWFDDKKQMGAHWSNCHEGREFVRQWIYSTNGKEAFQQLKDQLESLKSQTVWLTRHRDFVKSNLFDLYQFYLDPRIRLGWIHGSDKTMVSMHSESGPFVEVKSLRWLDREILKKFMLIKLIEGKAQERDYRLSTNINVTLERPDFSLKSYKIKVEQITQKGLLLRFDGGHVIEQIARGDGWKINADKSAGEFRALNGKVQFNVTFPTFGGINNQHYLFLKFDQFEYGQKVAEISQEVIDWSESLHRLMKKAA